MPDHLHPDVLLPPVPSRDHGAADACSLSVHRVVGDDTAMAALRLRALALNDGSDWSRCDDHAVAESLLGLRPGAAPADTPGAVALRLFPLAALRPAAPAPAAQRGGAAAAVGAGPRAPADVAADPALDQAAMAGALQQASRDGVPFVEECALPPGGGAG